MNNITNLKLQKHTSLKNHHETKGCKINWQNIILTSTYRGTKTLAGESDHLKIRFQPMSNNVNQAIKNTKTRSKRTRNHQKQLSSRASFLGFFWLSGRFGRIYFLKLQIRRLDHIAILAPIGFLRQAGPATRALADRAFKAGSRPFLLASVANKCTFIEVLAVAPNAQTTRHQKWSWKGG